MHVEFSTELRFGVDFFSQTFRPHQYTIGLINQILIDNLQTL